MERNLANLTLQDRQEELISNKYCERLEITQKDTMVGRTVQFSWDNTVWDIVGLEGESYRLENVSDRIDTCHLEEQLLKDALGLEVIEFVVS